MHLSSPTNDINVALGLSITVAVATYIIGILQQGPSYFKHLVSPFALMLPLNIIEELAKPLTMALRLSGISWQGKSCWQYCTCWCPGWYPTCGSASA